MENESRKTPYGLDHVSREEMIVYTKKVMDLAEDRAKDSIRITVIEKLCEDMSNDISSKFEAIQKKLETLTSRKKIKGSFHIGLSFLFGYIFPDIMTHLPTIISWLDIWIHRYGINT